MNVLLLTHRVPYPPNRGDRIRAYHLLKFLSSRYHVSLACLADEPFEPATENKLRGLAERVAVVPQSSFGRWARATAAFASGHTATSGLFASRRLHQTIRAWTKITNFDAVIAFCSSMAPYAFVPELKDVPVLIDLVDVDSQKWLDYAGRARGIKQRLYTMEGERLRKQERRLTQVASSIALVSEAEADLFRTVCPNDRTQAILNGVDLQYFQPAFEAESPRPASCVFVGALDYGANVDALTWFCETVWPEVKRLQPLASLELVGRRPTKSVRQLAGLPGVSLAADVPDVRPYLSRAAVAIAPLRIARGIQNKVLEAMAMGRPVLASPGAMAGLNVEPGVHVAQAEMPSEWVTTLIRLWRSDAERTALGRQARAYVEAHHSWEATLAPWQVLIQDSTAAVRYDACLQANHSRHSETIGKIQDIARGER